MDELGLGELGEVEPREQRELLEPDRARRPRSRLAHDEIAVLERDDRLERGLPGGQVGTGEEAVLLRAEAVDLLGDEPLVEQAAGGLDLVLARSTAALLDDAPVRRGERRVAEERPRTGRRKVELGRAGPRFEQLPVQLDRRRDSIHDRIARVGIPDGELEDVLEPPRAELAKEEEPAAEGAGHAGGEDPGSGY